MIPGLSSSSIPFSWLPSYQQQQQKQWQKRWKRRRQKNEKITTKTTKKQWQKQKQGTWVCLMARSDKKIRQKMRKRDTSASCRSSLFTDIRTWKCIANSIPSRIANNYEWQTITNSKQLQIANNYEWQAITTGKQLRLTSNYKWQAITWNGVKSPVHLGAPT